MNTVLSKDGRLEKSSIHLSRTCNLSGVPINQLDTPSRLPTINKPLRLTGRLCSTYEITPGFKPSTDIQKRKCNLTKKGYYIMRTHLLKTVEALDVRCAFFRRKKKFFSVSRKVLQECVAPAGECAQPSDS